MSDRDERLTEAMGEIRHNYMGHLCSCGADYTQQLDAYEANWELTAHVNNSNINFSTWEGFGKLLKWAQKQDWWSDFIYDYSELNTVPLDSGPYPEHAVAAFAGMTPEHFSNAVDFYLQGRG